SPVSRRLPSRGPLPRRRYSYGSLTGIFKQMRQRAAKGIEGAFQLLQDRLRFSQAAGASYAFQATRGTDYAIGFEDARVARQRVGGAAHFQRMAGFQSGA